MSTTQNMVIPVAGKGAVQMNGVDQLVVNFLKDHNLPGATVAVSKQGRLVWSKGYGYANTEKKIEMQPWHRSRIGSVSKVLTAIGVLKLVEDGKLSLTTPVYTFYDTSNWKARHGMTGAQYQQIFDQLAKQGFRLVQVSGYEVKGEARFAAIWEKSSGPQWTARHGLTSAQYQETFEHLHGQGFRLVQVSGYSINGEARFAAIWEKSSGPQWTARHGLTSAQYQETFEHLRGQGFRLVQVSGYEVQGQARFAAIWEKSSGPQQAARHGLTSAQYQQAFNELVGQGFRLVQVSGYSVKGEARFAAIWEKSKGPEGEARHGLSGARYQQTFEQLLGKGFRLVQVSGYSVKGEARFAAIWERMASSGPVGVLKDKDYTDAMVTGVANRYAGLHPSSVRQAVVAAETAKTLMWARNMQIRHLLSHTSGIVGSGQTDKAAARFKKDEDDLSYKEVHLSVLLALRKVIEHNEVLKCVGNGSSYVPEDDDNFKERMITLPPFGFAPATKRCYANHGFGLLGLVIAEVSGVPYHEFMRKRILLPIGLNHVVPYGMSVSSRDAAHHVRDNNGDPKPIPTPRRDKPSISTSTGGWAASAQDMVRLMCATDKLRNQPDVLKPELIDVMETVAFPEASAKQPLGWDSRVARGNSAVLSKGGKTTPAAGGARALILKFLPGYISNDGTDLSDINVAICINICYDGGSTRALLDKIALECGKANIPSKFDLFG